MRSRWSHFLTALGRCRPQNSAKSANERATRGRVGSPSFMVSPDSRNSREHSASLPRRDLPALDPLKRATDRERAEPDGPGDPVQLHQILDAPGFQAGDCAPGRREAAACESRRIIGNVLFGERIRLAQPS